MLVLQALTAQLSEQQQQAAAEKARADAATQRAEAEQQRADAASQHAATRQRELEAGNDTSEALRLQVCCCCCFCLYRHAPAICITERTAVSICSL